VSHDFGKHRRINVVLAPLYGRDPSLHDVVVLDEIQVRP
jgi:hypothetical protein